MRKTAVVADVVLLSVTFVWGVMFVFLKEAVAVMPVMTHLAVRFLLAAGILWISYACIKNKEPMTWAVWRRGAVMGVLLFMAFLFQSVGTQFTSASSTGFITGLCVVLVPVLGAVIYRIKLPLAVGGGVGIALTGLAVMSLRIHEPMQIGDLIVLFGSFAFALHILITAKYSLLHQPFLLASIQITVAGVLDFLAAGCFENIGEALSPEVWTDFRVLRALLIGAVFATAFAFWAQTHFQRFTTATHTAIIFASEPVFAAAAAVAIGGESLSRQTIMGGALILCGILLAELKGAAGETGGEAEPEQLEENGQQAV